jgi:hypothetical protein
MLLTKLLLWHYAHTCKDEYSLVSKLDINIWHSDRDLNVVGVIRMVREVFPVGVGHCHLQIQLGSDACYHHYNYQQMADVQNLVVSSLEGLLYVYKSALASIHICLIEKCVFAPFLPWTVVNPCSS